jgi:hypothetical protein
MRYKFKTNSESIIKPISKFERIKLNFCGNRKNFPNLEENSAVRTNPLTAY